MSAKSYQRARPIIEKCEKLRLAIDASLSHLRKDESLTYYFVGNYDLSPVLTELPGVKYTLQQAIEVSPMCAAGEERTKLMVMTAIGNLLSCGIIAPKQREVEANSPVGKVKQERISQLMKHFGGWCAAVELVRNTLAADGA